MTKLKALLTVAALLVGGSNVFGFVMIGPVMAAEQQSGNGISFNITDDLGGPKDIKNFYRWNKPYLTY